MALSRCPDAVFHRPRPKHARGARVDPEMGVAGARRDPLSEPQHVFRLRGSPSSRFRGLGSLRERGDHALLRGYRLLGSMERTRHPLSGGGPLGKVEDYRQLWDRARESAAASSKLVGPTVAYFATTDGVSPGSRRFPESEFSRYRNANFLNDLLGTTDAPDFENFSFHHYANLDESLQILTDSLESKLARLGNFSQEVDQVWATESNVAAPPRMNSSWPQD